ncbi:hypothetical protein TNCV_5093651 [Trichonephila clavipes]|nr:hypothetical protein TNCV_5093651 [Trichonephila clavipes]
MITNFFIPELNNHDVQELWFQQDGAACHTARATIDSLVYADKPQTPDHLEDNIGRVIADIRPQMLEKVIENWTSRLDYIRASRSSPMPEIIFKIVQNMLFVRKEVPFSSVFSTEFPFHFMVLGFFQTPRITLRVSGSQSRTRSRRVMSSSPAARKTLVEELKSMKNLSRLVVQPLRGVVVWRGGASSGVILVTSPRLEAHEIHRGKGLEVRLSLVLSIIQFEEGEPNHVLSSSSDRGSRLRGGRGSLMIKVTNSWSACHQFEPSTAEDLSCTGAQTSSHWCAVEANKECSSHDGGLKLRGPSPKALV